MLRAIALALICAAAVAPSVRAADEQEDKAKARLKAAEDKAKAMQRAAEAQAKAAEAQLRAATRALERAKQSQADAERRAKEAVEQARRALDDAAKEAKEGGKSRKEPYLGVITEAVPESLAAHLNLSGKGLLVARVQSDSPAEKAGIKQYDILLEFKGEKVGSPEQLKELVVKAKPGTDAGAVLLHAGKPTKLVVVVGEREAGKLERVLRRYDGEWKFEDFDKLKGKLQKDVEGKLKRLEPKLQEFKFGEFPGFGPRSVMRSSKNNETVQVTEQDGKVTVDVEYQDKDGKAIKESFTGSREEIKEKVGKLPESIRNTVRQAFESFGKSPTGKEKRTRIERRIEGEKPKSGEADKPTVKEKVRARVRLGAPGKDGKQEEFELDVSAPEALDKKLEGVPEEVREQVKKTLKGIQFPEKGLGRERSQ
jgi:hypothetical protein